MVTEQWGADTAALAVVRSGAAALNRLHERLAPWFGRAEVRARVHRSLDSLLGRAARKNGVSAQKCCVSSHTVKCGAHLTLTSNSCARTTEATPVTGFSARYGRITVMPSL